MKEVSLPPYKYASYLWRNCPQISIDSKRTCPIPCLYEPVLQLLGISVPLLKREEIVRTQHVLLCASACMIIETIWESGIENLPQT